MKSNLLMMSVRTRLVAYLFIMLSSVPKSFTAFLLTAQRARQLSPRTKRHYSHAPRNHHDARRTRGTNTRRSAPTRPAVGMRLVDFWFVSGRYVRHGRLSGFEEFAKTMTPMAAALDGVAKRWGWRHAHYITEWKREDYSPDTRSWSGWNS
jgi:hypothetical protein